MKNLKTLDQLQTSLDNGFIWRLWEIANLKIVAKNKSQLNWNTVVRAGVPLIYAHWEGFIKEASEKYLNFVANQHLKYSDLASCFVVFGAKKHLLNVIGSNKSKVNIEAVNFFRYHINDRAKLSLSNAINTESNLNSEVFKNIALSIGVKEAAYSSYYNLIDESLLRRRNIIAHGEYLDLTVVGFRNLADEVIKLLRMYKTDIENLASTDAYKA